MTMTRFFFLGPFSFHYLGPEVEGFDFRRSRLFRLTRRSRFHQVVEWSTLEHQRGVFLVPFSTQTGANT
jgi:hypothetical protein